MGLRRDDGPPWTAQWSTVASPILATRRLHHKRKHIDPSAEAPTEKLISGRHTRGKPVGRRATRLGSPRITRGNTVNLLEVTEWLLRQPPSWSRGLVVNMPPAGMSFHDRLFQASLWRDYAMTWHGRCTRTGADRRWCEEIGRMTYATCLRRARVNIYLARRLNRHSAHLKRGT